MGFLMATWLDSTRAFLRTAELLTRFTPSKVDDDFIASIKIAIDNPQIQAVVDWIINTLHVSPQLSTNAVIENVPQPMMAAAEESYGKIGDGKFIALLIKILPLILAL